MLTDEILPEDVPVSDERLLRVARAIYNRLGRSESVSDKVWEAAQTLRTDLYKQSVLAAHAALKELETDGRS